MKKLLFGAILLALSIAAPDPARAEVNISIGLPLPPPIIFPAPPFVVVLPDTDYVYVDPDIEFDLFFWDGWWWRPWEGRWYRSRYYDRGWVYYSAVPRFYFDVDLSWRGHYRDRTWYGRPWTHERVHHQQLHQNWKGWRDTRYWERQKTWGVQNYQPRPHRERQELRQHRQEQYQQRPDVQQHQRWKQERQRQQQVQRPRAQQPGRPLVQPESRQQLRRDQPEERGKITRPQGGPGDREERRRQARPHKERRNDEGRSPRGDRDR